MVLAKLPRLKGSDDVLPEVSGVRKWWERLRERAGPEGVRLHALRHSFASGRAVLRADEEKEWARWNDLLGAPPW
ncbi:MAG: hypothetical protein HYY96_03825 [Candidatus Tectomicrobia bacterium]|nr:hypothetical protein [Candidatus Tectomicrobia bacterium]